MGTERWTCNACGEEYAVGVACDLCAPSAEPAPAPKLPTKEECDDPCPCRIEGKLHPSCAGQPTAAPEGREPWKTIDYYLRVDQNNPREISLWAWAYSAGKASGDAEPDWHAFYTDSQAKLYHADELLASAAERERGLREALVAMDRVAGSLARTQNGDGVGKERLGE